MGAVDERDAHRWTADADRVPNTRRACERGRNGRRIAAALRRDVDVTNHLPMAPDRTCDLRALDIRMPGDRREQPACFAERMREEHARARITQERDALQNLFGRFWTEPLELGEAPVARCLLELLHGLDTKALVDLVNLRR